jgi:hypothetical protein
MNLSYRGNSYQTETSLLEIKEKDIAGKYRGQNWRHKLPRHIPQLKPKVYLQYRGVAYSTCPLVKVPPETPQCACTPMMKKSSQLSVKNLEKVHLENLRRNLERRLKLARVNGNQDLIDMLQKESQQLKLEI